ncbi:unnamed protein product [Closterium sp. Yama58-4]|nr:unnamed protein product [Closterium sp. Yama58-4]
MAGNTSAGAGESSAQDRSGSQDSGLSAPRGARTNQGSLVKEVLKNFTVEKFNVLDKMRDLYAKLATAGITYPEQTKCLKMLSLLPESWLQFTSGLSLPQNQSLWTLEWVRTKILEEDFRRRKEGGVETTAAAATGCKGADVAEDVASVVLDAVQRKTTTPTTNRRGTGLGRGAKSGRGGKSGAGGKMKGSCWYCEKEGHPWFLCYKKPDGWTPQNRHQDGGARRNQKNGANMVADSSDNNPKGNGGAEKKKERTAGQFFHVGDKGEQGDASAKVGAELHPLDYWVLDTGAAWTMTPRKDLLDEVRAAPINEVCSASGHMLKVAGAGRAAFKGADGKLVVLHDVLFVPDLKANLISLRKLGKAGVNTNTDGARTYKGQLGNRVLWDLHESKDVYRSMWQLPALAWHGGGQAGEGSASQGECNAVGGVGVKVSARSGETDWATAHRRLGHVAMPLLKQLEKDGAVKGLKLNGQPPDDNCEICLLSKFTCFPFHSVAGRSKKPLELVHMDLVGPLPVQGHKGERSLFGGEAECVVKRIRTDRGGEFLGAEMTAWLKKQGIQRELTTAYTPQSNGVAERANRTILETARALLIESGLSNSMWPHAVRHATVARNRVLTKVGDDSWVPLERWLGRKPPVDMLRVFGCMAVAHVPKTYRSKLGASAIWCVHLGLAAESKGWLLWEPSKGVLFDSRDVKFIEGMMYGSWEKQPEARVSQQMEQITMQLDLTPSVWEEGEEAAAGNGDGEKVQEASAGGENEQQLGTEEALLILPHGYDPDEEDEPAYCFLAPAPEEPASMEEALAGPDRDKWLASRDAEYQSLLENRTWDLVVLPDGKKAIQCKWVLRIKTDDKGQVTIYKSRLVAKGFMQKEKQDFNEIFAPTAKPPTLRVLLADAAVSGKFIIQMDISTAFLNGILEEDVYMTQPPGYEDEEMGFRTSSCDESLFLKGEGEKLVLFLVYVDDILLFSSSMKEIQKVQQQLMENFKCKNLGR